MNIIVLTLFPDMIEANINTSIVGRAIASGAIEMKAVNIRDYSQNAYSKVDDRLFGGGTGMLMMCQPIFDAWAAAISEIPDGQKTHTIYMSPKGSVFNQTKAIELSKKENLIFLCGHYEGVDQRVLDEIIDEEISLGDYVMTGGELAASVVIDTIARLVPGVLPNEEAYTEESHMNGTLEYPQYTRPAVWHDMEVPAILVSGHHRNIEKWKHLQSLYITMQKRPDLFEKLELPEEDLEELIEYIRETENRTK
ncbi:MAG: tRNA (guanosine(37)-N1)-methyltransferase TrmD [Saccharofermentanales bacterium]